MKQTRSRGYRRLFAALLIFGWAAAAIVAYVHWVALRAPAGVLLVAVIPGTLASYAALPPSSGIDGRLRAVLALSLSIAISLALGLGLALISDEVSRVAAGAGLAVALTAAGVIAIVRDDGRTPIALPERTRVAPAVVIVTGLLALAAIASVVAAVNVNTLPTDFTALSLTRESDGVRLSVTSHESGPVRFRYVLSEGNGVRLYSGTLPVDPEEDAAVVLPVAPGAGLVRAQLFKPGSGVPYRTVDLRS